MGACEKSQLGYIRPWFDITGEAQLRKYLRNTVVGISNYIVLQDFNSEFPKHPKDVLALQEWWPMNPYSGLPMRVFTREDGTMEDVFAGSENFGDLYWLYSEVDGPKGKINIGWLSVFMPPYDYERDDEWKFASDQSRWKRIGMNRGIAYSVGVSSNTDELVQLVHREPMQ